MALLPADENEREQGNEGNRSLKLERLWRKIFDCVHFHF
jgi:hypothetical protein